MIEKFIRKSAVAAAFLIPGIGLAQSPQVCDYNLFVLGNHTSSYSDVQGRVAVGGNASYTGYDFGLNLTPDPTRNDLIVGGTLNFSNGQVEKGSVVAGGAITLKGVTIAGGNVVSGGSISVTNGQVHGQLLPNQFLPVPVDFTSAGTFLRNAAAYYGSLPPTAPTVNQYGGIILTGLNVDVNIFSIPAATLANAWGVQINVPSGSTVLVNVTGASGKMPNGGYSYTGADAAHVVFNFYQATTLNIGGGQGMVLAPLADINFPSGVTTGTVAGKSLKGNGQINLAAFTGTLPQLLNGDAFCGDGGLQTQ